MGSHGTLAACGFHHRHLPPVLSQIPPCASTLERSLEICLGHSPVPRHLLLPSSECLPYHRLASTASVPGFPTLVAWLLPQLARHPSCRQPQAIPGLPLLSSTPPARHAHYQRAKNPTCQMLPVPSKSPGAPQAGRQGPGGRGEPRRLLRGSEQAREMSLLVAELGTQEMSIGLAPSPHCFNSNFPGL